MMEPAQMTLSFPAKLCLNDWRRPAIRIGSAARAIQEHLREGREQRRVNSKGLVHFVTVIKLIGWVCPTRNVVPQKRRKRLPAERGHDDANVYTETETDRPVYATQSRRIRPCFHCQHPRAAHHRSRHPPNGKLRSYTKKRVIQDGVVLVQ